MNVLKQIEDAARKIQDAKKLNDTLQSKHAVGSSDWHAHESIDDRLHEALAALGE